MTIDSLWKQSYGAIFIATGAHKSLRLGVSGEDLDGFYPGAAFLKDVNLGRRVELGERVAIIGGGNVAIDAARTAVRLGSKEVRIFYRRSKQEMPAYKEEVVASEAEGIMINTLSVPCRIMGKNGKVVGLECARAELADSDRSGRRKSIPIRGSEFVVGVDTVISAIGEVPDLSFINRQDIDLTSNRTIRVNPHTMATNIDGIFGGGDVATGPATVIEAIAAGRKAALAIDAYLSGREMAYEEDTPRIIDIEKLDVAGIKKRKRQKMSVLSVTRRIRDFREIEKGFQELEALREGDRCLQCGMFPKK